MPHKPWIFLVSAVMFLVGAAVSLCFLSFSMKEYIIQPVNPQHLEQAVVEPEPIQVKQETTVSQPVQAKPNNNKLEQVIWPVSQKQIILNYGWQQHPVYADWRFHAGIDIALAEGSPVQAVASGIVSKVSHDPLTGNTILVTHANWQAIYGSLAEIAVVEGEHVEQGKILGKVSQCSAEPYNHLHFGILQVGAAIDPLTKLP